MLRHGAGVEMRRQVLNPQVDVSIVCVVTDPERRFAKNLTSNKIEHLSLKIIWLNNNYKFMLLLSFQKTQLIAMKFKFQNFQHTYISGAMAWELRFK